MVTGPKFVGPWLFRRTNRTRSMPTVIGFWVRHVKGGDAKVIVVHDAN